MRILLSLLDNIRMFGQYITSAKVIDQSQNSYYGTYDPAKMQDIGPYLCIGRIDDRIDAIGIP